MADPTPICKALIKDAFATDEAFGFTILPIDDATNSLLLPSKKYKFVQTQALVEKMIAVFPYGAVIGRRYASTPSTITIVVKFDTPSGVVTGECTLTLANIKPSTTAITFTEPDS